MKAFLVDIFGTVGAMSGVVYVTQVITQIRIYGWHQWIKFGLGTGVEIHQGREEEN